MKIGKKHSQKQENPEAYIWATQSKVLVVIPNSQVVWWADIQEIKNLLNGKVKKVPILPTYRKTPIIIRQLDFHVRRFVIRSKIQRALTPEEEETYRSFGYIPVERHPVRAKGGEVGKGSPIIRFRCDAETLRQIKAFQKTLPNFNTSETVRYLVIKGLEHMRNTDEVRLKLPKQLYERLEEHRKLFNKTEELNLSLAEFIQLILERAVGMQGHEEGTQTESLEASQSTSVH
ncbi:MAG: hypothetical protein OH337_04055 [Candidatus Parvarchaeota archaeon]|nr:hypothetical protein [Candidatus Haiyanarchaeum thermophilum]